MKISFFPTGILTVCASSIPAGTGTTTVLRTRIWPEPRQESQGLRMCVPLPPHLTNKTNKTLPGGQGVSFYLLQVDLIMKGPVETVSIPVPWQLGHFSGLVPGSQPEPPHRSQLSITVTFRSFFRPLAASCKQRSHFDV